MDTEVTFSVNEDTPMVYSNWASVQATPADVIIRFCLVDPAQGGVPSDDGTSSVLQSVEARTLVSVYLNPKVARGLARALETVLGDPEEETDG